MSAWLVIAALLAGLPKGDPCENRCASVVKPCNDFCEKSYPKAKADECKKACSGTVPGCKEQCHKPRQGDDK